jgi:hypothetical protein
VNDGLRVSLDESVRNFFAADFGGGFARRGEHGNTFLGIVRVRSQHVDGIMFEQPLRGAAHAFTPESGERRSRHLNHAPLLSPLHHPLRSLAQNRIAFGMRDHRSDAAVAQLRKTVCNLLRNAVVAQFDQHVVRAFDGIACGIGQHILQIVVGEMEVAAQAECGKVLPTSCCKCATSP